MHILVSQFHQQLHTGIGRLGGARLLQPQSLHLSGAPGGEWENGKIKCFSPRRPSQRRSGAWMGSTPSYACTLMMMMMMVVVMVVILVLRDPGSSGATLATQQRHRKRQSDGNGRYRNEAEVSRVHPPWQARDARDADGTLRNAAPGSLLWLPGDWSHPVPGPRYAFHSLPGINGKTNEA
ncbi:oxidoreductase NAD-binding domain protein [Anopheles sinensis]|uniref:Oxidoreductase NAD-binding domain protein n=1 Tax=Anopheles sinensis TaxID=74873 RepID=A0A084VH44_ANOSI|nr:oxidoreductase NAD-binding domain protein [Anopheles sinensis]